ncbi:MAG: hypothetical protein GY857_03900 [Desulfobacula sp.]|nr:hypothetical protein [Desulfobacula sp.]
MEKNKRIPTIDHDVGTHQTSLGNHVSDQQSDIHTKIDLILNPRIENLIR